MAHHKRGKPRTQSSPHVSRRSLDNLEKTAGYRWMGGWPRWHDILCHSRPRRRLDSKVAGDVVADRVDAEAAIWAAEKKPHKYYW